MIERTGVARRLSGVSARCAVACCLLIPLVVVEYALGVRVEGVSGFARCADSYSHRTLPPGGLLPPVFAGPRIGPVGFNDLATARRLKALTPPNNSYAAFTFKSPVDLAGASSARVIVDPRRARLIYGPISRQQRRLPFGSLPSQVQFEACREPRTGTPQVTSWPGGFAVPGPSCIVVTVVSPSFKRQRRTIRLGVASCP